MKVPFSVAVIRVSAQLCVQQPVALAIANNRTAGVEVGSYFCGRSGSDTALGFVAIERCLRTCRCLAGCRQGFKIMLN